MERIFMSEPKQETETEQFIVENSNDLTTAIAGDTDETSDGEGLQPKAEGEETTDVKVEPKAEVEESKAKKPSRAQRRIQRQQDRNKELAEENERLQAELDSQSKSEIDIDDYEDYKDYEKALAESKEKKPKDETKEAFDQDDLNAVFDDGIEKYENFDELLRAPDLALTEEVLSTVLESDKADDIFYHLANDKDLTREIAGMTDRQRTKAILKIEMKLESKPNAKAKKKVISNAPKPITPVDGSSSKPISLDDDDLSFGEYEKELNRQLSTHKSNGWA